MPLSFQESLEQLGPHHHAMLLSRNRGEAGSVVARYLRIGLARGEKCVLLVSRNTANQILADLRSHGTDVGSSLSQGSLLVAPEVPDGRGKTAWTPDRLEVFLRTTARSAAAEGRSGMRCCHEIGFLLGTEKTPERLAELSSRMHGFLKDHRALSLCLFLSPDFPPDLLLYALRTHSSVICGERLLDNFYYIHPSLDLEEILPARELEERLRHLRERHEQLSRIRRQTLRQRRLQDVTASLLSQASVPNLFRAITEGVAALGYRMCWIGLAKPDGAVEPVAVGGDPRGYLEEIQVRWDDSPLAKGPTGTSIRTGKPSRVRDVRKSRRFGPWRDKALARGYLSIVAFPLAGDGRPNGALTVYAPLPDAFGEEQMEELSAFAQQASLTLQRAQEFRKLSASEERLRRLFERIPAACFTFDREGIVRHWNFHCRKIYGYSPKEAVGKSIHSLIVRPGDEPKTDEVIRRVFAGESFSDLEWEDRCADGSVRRVITNVYPFGGASGDVELGISVNVDITARSRMEEEKEQVHRNLARAQKMQALGALAGGIAHDFSRLVESIQRQAAALGERIDPDTPEGESLRAIRGRAEEAAELTRRLMGFARGGKKPVRAVRLNETVRKVAALVSRSFGPAYPVRPEPGPGLRPVEADPDQLEQVLYHLCLNARDAMPGGGPITLRTRNRTLSAEEARALHVAEPGNHVILSVSDTGEGMTEEVRLRVFEPFFTTRRNLGRSGLGMAMVYGIVKNHRGGVSLDSEPGRGTTVHIALPALRVAEGSEGEPGETVLVAEVG